MPVEPIELLKLLIGLIIITIPGYLWSLLFSTTLSHLERLLFGVLNGLAVFTIAPFTLNYLFHLNITQTIIWVLYAVYLSPVVILVLLSIRRYHLPTMPFALLKNKTIILLLLILCFSFFMVFLPHLANNYYLPFHVDEWIHYSYTRAVIEQGTITTFINPYTGSGTITSPEIGFYLASASIHWISTSSLATIFLFMPALIGAFLSLTAFVIGQRSPRRFGLEAAFLVAFIPTTVRFLGPSFYVPITLSLLVLLFLIWLVHLKKLQGIILIPVFILFVFLIHPVTALVSVGVLLVYTLFLLLEKEYRSALLISVLTIVPILLVVFVIGRWNSFIDLFFKSVSGQQFGLDFNLPPILVSFTDLGLLTWGLLIIGVYFAFTKGKALLQTLSISAIAFIIIIGLYDKFGYGFPSIYERLFLILFLLVVLIAGFGLAEIRRTLTSLKENGRFTAMKKWVHHLDILVPVTLGVVILLIALPAHLSTPYYEIITEQDYETFTWIHDHINSYRDSNHSYSRAVVDPYKASPFSAVTGLYIISSSMNPVYGYNLVGKMETFLQEKCRNTSFLDKYHLSVIYGDADNANLTKIHENVYLYPRVSET
jgi:hypothetical protein